MTRTEWPGFKTWLPVCLAIWAAFVWITWEQPAKADARYHRVLACQVAILMKLPEPNRAQLPVYLNTPSAFTRGETNTFEPMETFEFTTPDDAGQMERREAFCIYDDTGRLIAANID